MTSRVATMLGCLMACGGGGDGSDPANALVDIEAEPAGANCSEGGSVIHSGTDVNGNDTLDADEIETTSYVCDPDVVLRTDDEPVGTNCPNGGTVVHSGADDDEDGVLDDDEIDETSYICAAIGGVLDADFTITTELDVAVLGTFVEITGNLLIRGPIAELNAPNLKTVGGDVYVQSPTATSASFPVLETVGQGLFVESPCNELIGLSAPALTTVVGDVYFKDCPKLDTIDLSVLTTIDDAGQLYVGSLDALTQLSLPALAITDHWAIRDNAVLTQIQAPKLVEISGEVTIDNNAELSAFDFTALDIVGQDITITNNPKLSCVAAGDLVLQLTTYSGTTTIALNQGCVP